MPRPVFAFIAGPGAAAIVSGAMLSGCASAPMQYASKGAHATYDAASTGAQAVYSTGSVVYSGMGNAAKRPFQDFNMLQDPIPPVLKAAESKPYDVDGLDSCAVILDRVAELDLALGPDVDQPKDNQRTRLSKGAAMAAEAALEAAGAAAEGILPMRGLVKRMTGATRYEAHVKHALLAGTVRRGFLKALGMAHNCSWPAAPLGFEPVQLATTSPSVGSVFAASTPATVAISASVASGPSQSSAAVNPRYGQTMAFQSSSSAAQPTGAPWGAVNVRH